MSNLKKMLSVIMAVAMLMSVMVMGTGAAFTDQKDVKNTEATDMAVALGIIKGYEDGSFKPTANVTRAEMAKMICIMLNAGKDPTLGTVATHTFTDTQTHWAAGYIEYCATAGIVAGIGGGLFAPDTTVTATQAAKMLLVAIGYDAAVEGFNGVTWNVKINVRANGKGLYNDISVDPNAPLNRDNAAQMIWNALNAGMVEYESGLGANASGQITTVKTLKDRYVANQIGGGSATMVSLTMMMDKFKTQPDVTGIMTAYDWNKGNKEFDYMIAGKPFSSKNDYTGLFGLNVKVVYTEKNSNKTVYGMFAKESKILAKGTVSNLEKSNDITSIKLGDTKYKISYKSSGAEFAGPQEALNALPLMTEHNYNNVTTGSLDTYGEVIAADSGAKAYEIKLIDDNNDNKVDRGIYLPFKYAKVSSVGKTSVSLVDGTDGKSLKFDEDNIYEGIAKDDYVKIIPAGYSAYEQRLVTKMNAVEGTVTGTKTAKIQIDGTWYTVANAAMSVPSVGSKSTFYTVGNYVYFANQLQAATIDNLLYVAATESGLSNKAKVYFADGTSDTVMISKFNKSNGDEDTASLSSQANKMFTYSKKGSEYTLTALGAGNDLGYKIPTTLDSGYITKAEDKTTGKLMINGLSYAFADDAIVFIEKPNSNDVKVVTGKVARDYAQGAGLTSGRAIQGETGTTANLLYSLVNNTNTVRALSIVSTNAVPSSKGETGNYGYIVSDGAFKTKVDGTTYNVVTIWNGTKNVDLLCEDNLTFAKGDVITYNALGDNKVDGVKNVTSKALVNKADGGVKAAVKGSADAGKTLTLVKPNAKAPDPESTQVIGDFTLTNDTKYLYVDSENFRGEESGSVALAIQESNKYLANVIVYVDNGATDNQIDLIVIDTNNQWN